MTTHLVHWRPREDPEIGHKEIFVLHFVRTIWITIDCYVILEASENVLPLVEEHIALNPAPATPTSPGFHYAKGPAALIAYFPILCAMDPPFQS